MSKEIDPPNDRANRSATACSSGYLVGCGVEYVHWLPANLDCPLPPIKTAKGNPIELMRNRQLQQRDADRAAGDHSPARRSSMMIRVVKCLNRLEIDSFDKLANVTSYQWRSARNFGPKAYEELRIFAKEYGVNIMPLLR